MLPRCIHNLIMKFMFSIVLDIDLKKIKPNKKTIVLKKKRPGLMFWEQGLWEYLSY